MKILNNFLIEIYESITKTILNLRNLGYGAYWRSRATSLAELMVRTLAPLRKIVSRDIRVIQFDSVRKTLPISFVIIDRLECGHEYDCLGWDVLDLLNPYTTNPEVTARRHRCHPCAELLATRKQPQSVSLVAVKKVGAA